MGKGSPNEKGVSWGTNKFRDTPELDNKGNAKNGTGNGGGDDKLIIDSVTGEEYFNTGANGICETNANNTPILNNKLTNLQLDFELDKFYSQMGIDFIGNVTIEPIKYINYDIDRNNKLISRYSNEANQIYNSLNIPVNNTIATSNVPTIILIHDFDDATLNGGATNFGSNVVVMKTNRNITDGTIQKTLAHEVGHALFSLYHPWDDTFGVCKTGSRCYPIRSTKDCNNIPQTQPTTNYDQYNLMDYIDYLTGKDNRTLFRKYQWDLINKN